MAKLLKGLNETLKDFDGNELKDADNLPITIKTLIKNSIASTKADDSIRAMDLALKIHNANNQLEVEDADFNLIKKAVDDNPALVNSIKAPILKVLNGVEEVIKKEDPKIPS